MKRPDLMVVNGELAGRRFSVPSDGIRLGRSSTNDVHIPDEELSRNHCMFEPDGPDGIRIVDLASANGTFVNGRQLGSEARPLKVGDTVEVGATTIKIVGETEVVELAPAPAPGSVDLGLGTSAAAGTAPSVPAKRFRLANLILAAVALVVVAAIAFVLCLPGEDPSRAPSAAPAPIANDRLSSLRYEKVEADATRIFRYEMTLDEDGNLHVVYDDVPSENRHAGKAAKLSEKAAKRMAAIFETSGWSDLEAAYTGPSAAQENALRSWRIRTVTGNRISEVLVENEVEPEAFRRVREALEAFANNELGIWATQYSKEQLLTLSAQSAELGDSKWEERDVEYGNLNASVKAYREAVFYLETVSPKPEDYAALKEKLATAESELDRRYKDQRFNADRAINLGDWEVAAGELRILCQLVPDKDDDRYAEASAKLVDVESRLAKAKKGGK